MKIDVLDKGYVRLVESMGDDLTVVNTARVSFDKESRALSQKDEKLIHYLVKHKHDSCLRHCVVTFEVYAPLMVARQWYKHAVSSSHWDDQNGWNESSRRYITENEEFYVPDQFLGVPENMKQGAAGPVDAQTNKRFRDLLAEEQERGLAFYRAAIEAGIAPEEARLFLPAYGMYVRWRWTASLNSIMNFLSLRTDGHAQSAIREYADKINDIIKEIYPVTHAAWMEHRTK